MYILPLLLLLLVVARGLWRTPDDMFGMYANQDGMWAAWNIAAILEWGRFLDLSPFNPLSGMGSLFLPNLPWLNPAAAALALPLPKSLTYLLSYLLYSIEVFASIVLLFRTLGLSPLRSALGSLLHLFMLLPPLIFATEAMPWYALAPVNAHLMAMANLALACFISLGHDARPARNALLGLAIAAAIAVGFVSAPVTFLTYVPVYGTIAGAILVWQRREPAVLRWRLIVLAVVVLAAWALGVVDYLRGTAALSARSEVFPSAFSAGARLLDTAYWLDAWRKFSFCDPAEVPLCIQPRVFWVHVLALLGAGFQLWRGRGVLRVVAGAFLALVAALEFYAFTSHVALFGSLHTIRAGFIMWSLYAFIPLFVACLLFAPFDLLREKQGKPQADPHFIVASILLLCVPVAAYGLWNKVIAPNQPAPSARNETVRFLGRSHVRSPEIGAIAAYLAKNASIRPDSLFRGHTVTYLGDPHGHVRNGVAFAGPGMAPDIHADARQYLNRHYGHRFQEMDLWEIGVPTLEEYGQWVSKPAFEFFKAVFSEPSDRRNPNFLHVYRPNLDALRSLGARFLISDAELREPGVRLVASESASVGAMYLYELAPEGPVIASPTRLQRVTTFQEAVAAFKALAGDKLANAAIVFDDIPGSFQKAEKVDLILIRDGFRVVAKSKGASLAVLPLQFSRCWRFEAPSAPQTALFRANAVQTLLRFSGDIDLSVRFDFGLLDSSRCRLEDAQEMARLGLK